MPPSYGDGGTISKMKRQGKLNRNIIFESVLTLFAKIIDILQYIHTIRI